MTQTFAGVKTFCGPVLNKLLTLDEAIGVLNLSGFKFETGNSDYTDEWVKDHSGDSATLTRYITKYKDSEQGRGERYYDCLDEFTVIAVAEKLLREGK